MLPTHTAPHAWPAQRSGPAASRAREFAELIVRRTGTTEDVLALAARSAEQATYPAGWYMPGLSHGHAGLALLHLEAARTGIADHDLAFGYVREAFAATELEPLEGPGLFGGTSGLALALAECAKDEPRFAPSLWRLHDQLAQQVIDNVYPTVERAVSDEHYDLITGAAGTLAYLSSVHEPDAKSVTAIELLADYLIWLSEPSDDEHTPRRWLLTPQSYPPLDTYHQKYPHGYLNLGLAHGVPGVVAALASAWRAGHRRPGHRAAMDALTSWIRDSHSSDRFGPVWADGVAVDENGRELPPDAHCDQIAWCYGTAGVCASLLTVARATGDEDLAQVAVDGFDAVLARTRETTLLSPTLCHGHSGILALCLEFGDRSPYAREVAPLLLDELLAYGDPSRPLVFADQETPGVYVDDPSFLTGAAGVALTLLAAVSELRPGWFTALTGR